jgi:acid phosphatase (class A)
VFRTLATAAALAALAACASTSAGPAQTIAMGGDLPPTKLSGYLAPSAIDGRVILGPPPSPGSPHDRADRAFYESTRSLKDSPRWAEAIQDNDLWRGGALKRFSCALGADISEGRTPAAWTLLHRIELDVRTFGTTAKDHFNRRRPALGNDLPICVPREKWLETNSSYPSGHAMVAWAWALIMTEARPDRADPLLKLGRESGESRVICGVHFPSDVEAGRTLAAGMVARLHADAAFMADLEKMKRELAAAPPPQACPA